MLRVNGEVWKRSWVTWEEVFADGGRWSLSWGRGWLIGRPGMCLRALRRSFELLGYCHGLHYGISSDIHDAEMLSITFNDSTP